MSKERELLKKVIRNMQYLNYSCNKNLRDEITELLAQPEQTEQEPVAWKVVDKTTGDFMFSRVKPNARSYTYDEVIPLYASPPKREALSDEQIRRLDDDVSWFADSHTFSAVVRLIRSVEKAHGIGVGNA